MFPYCRQCLSHVEAWGRGPSGVMVAAVLAGLMGLIVVGMFGIAAGIDSSFILTMAMMVGALVASMGTISWLQKAHQTKVRNECSERCSEPSAAVKYGGWDGSVQFFSFASDRYAAKFAAMNRAKLVNVSAELRQLLSDSRSKERDSGPGNQEGTRGEKPSLSHDEMVQKWIEKIGSYKGAVARRNALQRGLAEIDDPNVRLRLMNEASKIEVQAVLDRVDTLKTASAKQRHLKAAMEQLQADDVPDEMQAKELELLRDALRALEDSQPSVQGRHGGPASV